MRRRSRAVLGTCLVASALAAAGCATSRTVLPDRGAVADAPPGGDPQPAGPGTDASPDPGPGTAEVGLGAGVRAPFEAHALVPLTLVGPVASCPDAASIKARAAGVVVALGLGERVTLYLPRGSHVVRVLGAGAHDVTVALGDRGAEVVLGACAGAEPAGAAGRE